MRKTKTGKGREGGRESWVRRDDREGIKKARDEMPRYKGRESESDREISDAVIGRVIQGVIVPWKGF